LELKRVLFVPGFLGDEETLKLVPKILNDVQPAFNEAGWEIVVSNYYRGEPTNAPLEGYSVRVFDEIINDNWDAIIAHSMGGLLLPYDVKVPVVIIESPAYGVTRWQFWVINLLARIKGQGGFPLNNLSVQGMLRGSQFMKVRRFMLFVQQGKLAPLWTAHALQINGALGLHFLSRKGGDTFGKLPGIKKYREFPGIDHVGILTNPEVIECVLKFLNQHASLEEQSSGVDFLS